VRAARKEIGTKHCDGAATEEVNTGQRGWKHKKAPDLAARMELCDQTRGRSIRPGRNPSQNEQAIYSGQSLAAAVAGAVSAERHGARLLDRWAWLIYLTVFRRCSAIDATVPSTLI
jgi:hypothetical protein